MACNAIATVSAQVPLRTTMPLAEAALKTAFGDAIQIDIFTNASPPLLTATILFENYRYYLLYRPSTGVLDIQDFNNNVYRDQETEQIQQSLQKLTTQVRSVLSQVAAAALAKSVVGRNGRIQNVQRTANATLFTLKV